MHTGLWEKITSSLCIGLVPESIGLMLFGTVYIPHISDVLHVCFFVFIYRLKPRRLLRPWVHASLRRRGCDGTKGLRDSIYLGGLTMHIYIYMIY